MAVFLLTIYISWTELKFVPNSPVYNSSQSIRVMASNCIGDKPLHKPMMAQFIETWMRHPVSTCCATMFRHVIYSHSVLSGWCGFPLAVQQGDYDYRPCDPRCSIAGCSLPWYKYMLDIVSWGTLKYQHHHFQYKSIICIKSDTLYRQCLKFSVPALLETCVLNMIDIFIHVHKQCGWENSEMPEESVTCWML